MLFNYKNHWLYNMDQNRSELFKKLKDDFLSFINKFKTDKEKKDINSKAIDWSKYKDVDYLEQWKREVLKKNKPDITDAELEKLIAPYKIKIQESDLMDEEVDYSNLSTKDELNPKFWNKDGKLDSEVRYTLLKVIKEYFKFLGIEDAKFSDIVFTGSLANYNWTDKSDVDMHILLDYAQFGDKDKMFNFFKNLKNLWSEKYDIKIHGFPIEIFVQDKDQPKDWTAMYSILNDKWIKEPKKLDTKIDKETIRKESKILMDKIDKIEKDYDKDVKSDDNILIDIEELQEKIRLTRTEGLQNGGEYSTGNLIFKVLRSSGYLDKLYNIKVDIINKDLSLNEENE